MVRIRKYHIISALFLLMGIFFVFSSSIEITGAIIGLLSPFSSLGNMIIGLGAIGISFIIFMFGESDLEKKIKSFRRHMEKKEQKKVSYEEARSAYEAAEKRYWKDVGKGSIKQSNPKRPLQFIEEITESQSVKEMEENNEKILRHFTNSYLEDPTARRLAENTLKNQNVAVKIKRMLELYTQGHNMPGGLKPDSIEGTKGVHEFRSKKGSRIYWRGDINLIDIVGLGNKSNYKQVIKHLQRKYPE